MNKWAKLSKVREGVVVGWVVGRVGGYTYSVGTLQWVVNMENDSQGWSAQSHFLFSLFHDCIVFQLFLLFVILTEHFLSVIVIFQ